MDLSNAADKDILAEIGRRFEEKNASIKEMEFMTKKLLEMNEKTKKAEEIKGEFLSIIKNEFNNPLSILLNFANSLVNKKNPDKIEQISSMIHMELLRLDFHFKNLFAATEIEAGEIANDYANVNFEEIFNDCKKPIQYLIDEKNIELNFECRLTDVVTSDPSKVYLIMMNLVSNACEFSFPGSKVNVTVKEDGENTMIAVEDFGEGIHLDYHAKIFDRFSKFSSGRTRAHTGLGLGLSVCRGFAEALQGEVNFESKEGWTIFTVIFPKTPEGIEFSGSGDADTTFFDDFDDAVEM